MIFAGIVGADVGMRPFGYVTSMVVTIGLWLTMAPAIGAITAAERSAEGIRPLTAFAQPSGRLDSDTRRPRRARASSLPPQPDRVQVLPTDLVCPPDKVLQVVEGRPESASARPVAISTTRSATRPGPTQASAGTAAISGSHRPWSVSITALVIAVRTNPGPIDKTRTPYGQASSASPSASRKTPAFAQA